VAGGAAGHHRDNGSGCSIRRSQLRRLPDRDPGRKTHSSTLLAALVDAHSKLSSTSKVLTRSGVHQYRRAKPALNWSAKPQPPELDILRVYMGRARHVGDYGGTDGLGHWVGCLQLGPCESDESNDEREDDHQ
jgi:hypothetical protein